MRTTRCIYRGGTCEKYAFLTEFTFFDIFVHFGSISGPYHLIFFVHFGFISGPFRVASCHSVEHFELFSGLFSGLFSFFSSLFSWTGSFGGGAHSPARLLF